MIVFDKEIDFEDALVKMLTEKYGWKDGVIGIGGLRMYRKWWALLDSDQ